MPFRIRPYHPSDLARLYRLCLLTGHNGADATARYRDPDLLGLYYLAPYVQFEPELAFVLLAEQQPCGYVVGARDSVAFGARCEHEWFPILRQRYPLPPPEDLSPDAELIRLFHTHKLFDESLRLYPAHLHIDLLPVAQGHGWGRQLLETFFQALRERQVPGVQLGVTNQNQRAVRFYERLGFQRLKVFDAATQYGMRF